MTKPNIELLCGDCIKEMKKLSPQSIDMVLTDPPYGSTKCAWDIIIPLDDMWECLKRVVRPNGVIALFGKEPFLSAVRMSNIKMFKYDWIWDKITARGHLVAKKRPLSQHEVVSIFYKKAPTYNPQMEKRDRPVIGREYKRTSIMGGKSSGYRKVYTHKYPKTILTFKMDKNVGHPTQKPVALMKYLIMTYTNPGDTVLDFAMGSGTTGVACKELDRNFIGIEIDKDYFDLAKRRICQS